jgi:acetyltransferase-like isoleucine patch superfamily enzyme
VSLYIGLHRRIGKTREKLCTMKAKALFYTHGDIKVGKNCVVRGNVYISNCGKIKIGDNVRINSANWANPIGGGERTNFQIMAGGLLTIGDYTGISNCSITAANSVKIGNNVLIGAGVKIYDTDFHPLEAVYRYGIEKDNSKIRANPVVIEDGVFVGGGSYILKGSHIGRNSIIGAGSVVAGGGYRIMRFGPVTQLVL